MKSVLGHIYPPIMFPRVGKSIPKPSTLFGVLADSDSKLSPVLSDILALLITFNINFAIVYNVKEFGSICNLHLE